MPLEAQRLGLEAYASDLIPVAVLINKAMIVVRSPKEVDARLQSTDYCQLKGFWSNPIDFNDHRFSAAVVP